MFSHEFCEICKNTFFVEHHRSAASGVTIVVKGELTNDTGNHDTKTKAYVLI